MPLPSGEMGWGVLSAGCAGAGTRRESINRVVTMCLTRHALAKVTVTPSLGGLWVSPNKSFAIVASAIGWMWNVAGCGL